MAGIGAPAPLPHLSLVLYAGSWSGTLTKTLGALLSNADGAPAIGKVTVGGSLAKTLAPMSISSAGTAILVRGSIDAPVYLPHMAFVMYEIAGIIGGTIQTLESLTVASAGTVPGNEIWAYEDEDRPARPPSYFPRTYNIDWFQAATVMRNDTGGIAAAVLKNLDPLTAIISSTNEVGCTLTKTLDDMTGETFEGAVDVGGTLTATLEAMTAVATASTLSDYVVTLFGILDTLTVVSVGLGDSSGTLTQTLGNLTLVSTIGNEVSATSANTLQNINAEIVGSVLSDIVATFYQPLADMTCQISGGENIIDQPSASTGGWPRRHREPKNRGARLYEMLPDFEEVRLEKQRLAELPKRAQNAVNRLLGQATNDVTSEQAPYLASAYLQESMQSKLEQRAKEAAKKERAKWDEQIATISHALILDELRKKSDRAALIEALSQKAAEEAEVNDILDLWMSEL